MAARLSRLFSSVAAGGLLATSLALSGGTAAAQETAGEVVPAECGDRVSASPGDTVRVTPALGTPFTAPVTSGMAPITRLLSGALCRVQVDVLEPAATAAARAAPPRLKPAAEPAADAASEATGAAREAAGAVLEPEPEPAPRATAEPEPETPPTRAAAPSPAPPPAMSPQAVAAAAPAFAPAFGALPASFLRFAQAPPGGAAGGLRAYEPGLLFDSAFPGGAGLDGGAPAYLGYDPASAVTTASQVQALPVDGLSRGVGLPATLAVLVFSGVAAFAVRRWVLARARSGAGERSRAATDTDRDPVGTATA